MIMMNNKSWWLGECRMVKPLMQKSEDGEQEKVTRLELVMVALGCIALMVLSGIAMKW